MDVGERGRQKSSAQYGSDTRGLRLPCEDRASSRPAGIPVADQAVYTVRRPPTIAWPPLRPSVAGVVAVRWRRG